MLKRQESQFIYYGKHGNDGAYHLICSRSLTGKAMNKSNNHYYHFYPSFCFSVQLRKALALHVFSFYQGRRSRVSGTDKDKCRETCTHRHNVHAEKTLSSLLLWVFHTSPCWGWLPKTIAIFLLSAFFFSSCHLTLASGFCNSPFCQAFIFLPSISIQFRQELSWCYWVTFEGLCTCFCCHLFQQIRGC